MAGFVDESQLNVRAGDGGAGCAALRREGPETRGGPNGGDGGDGGDIWLVADRNVASLLAFWTTPTAGPVTAPTARARTSTAAPATTSRSRCPRGP